MGMMPHPGARLRSADGFDGRPRHFRIDGCNVSAVPRCIQMKITPELIEQHQLTTSEYEKIVTLLGREPS